MQLRNQQAQVDRSAWSPSSSALRLLVCDLTLPASAGLRAHRRVAIWKLRAGTRIATCRSRRSA
jgi:hypothetical protein